MFVMYNASLTVEGIYFEERTAEPGVDKSLFRMYQSPYKWLRLRRNIFDVINQIAFTIEGVNTEWQNLTINASRLILIGQLYSLYDCAYFQGGGIGNTVIINNTRFLGSNKLGYNRLMTITQPQNITFANNMFDDFLWENRVFGLISGYTASTSCAFTINCQLRIGGY